PVDVHDRPTVQRLEAADVFDRPTVQRLEPVILDELVDDAPTGQSASFAGAASSPKAFAPPPLPPSVRSAPRPAPQAPAKAPSLASRTAPSPASRGAPQAPKAPKAPKATKPAVKPPSPPPPRVAAKNDLADDLDATFAELELGGAPSGSAGMLDADLADVRALFGQLAANHMRQVRDFVIELRWGPTPTMWIAVCEPSVESLRSAAEKLEFGTLASGLRDLATAMRGADAASATVIDGADRDRILAAHAALEAILPETFALDGERSQREAAIVHALLSQIPDVRKVTIDKLYAAGLTTLEAMLLATVEDLVATTAIPEVLAERIVERFRRYRQEMASVAIDETRAQERAEIVGLVDQLRRQNAEFEQAAAGWTSDDIQRKKDVLLARAQTMLAIDLQLARLGEMNLVRELERLPFARKLLGLEAFLAEAESRYAAAPRAAAPRGAAQGVLGAGKVQR
ncbi:MAG TPA: hypothetical protein VM204_01735, partial [Gaiellaceae bacterium]|nr:hypothetical protein [Gaiellaceae bacterium]